MKKFWLDLETTGLDAKDNRITEIGALFEDTDKPDIPPKEFHVFIKYETYPDDYETGAGRVTGITKEYLNENGVTEEGAWVLLISFLDGCINKYKKEDKALVLGYNIGFDETFFRQFMQRFNETKYYIYGTYFYTSSVDVRTSYMMGVEQGVLLALFNHKLITVAKSFGIEFGAHSAIEDIKATKQVYEKIIRKLRG